MQEHQGSEDSQIPLGQRLLDKPFVLLLLGILVMALFYTGWGLLEVILLPTGKLP